MSSLKWHEMGSYSPYVGQKERSGYIKTLLNNKAIIKADLGLYTKTSNFKIGHIGIITSIYNNDLYRIDNVSWVNKEDVGILIPKSLLFGIKVNENCLIYSYFRGFVYKIENNKLYYWAINKWERDNSYKLVDKIIKANINSIKKQIGGYIDDRRN